MNKKLLAACLCCCLCGTALAEGQESVSALVQTAGVRQMEVYSRVSGYGTVVPEPGATLNLNFAKGGKVGRLLVTPGQQVKRGTPLLEIITDPAGRLAYVQAENAVAFARSELHRIKSLYARQLATRSQAAAAVRALNDAEAALRAQQATGDGVKNDKLTSPFAGTVVSVSVSPGDRFLANANLVQLVRTDFLRARLGIEPEDSQQISAGMKVRLSSVFNPQNMVAGEVVQVAGQVDPQTQLVDVAVRFKGGTLLPGMRLKGEIAVAGHIAQAVPRQAVLRDGTGAYLFQVAGGKAHRISVATGLEDGDWIEVVNPVLSGAPVVVLGNYELQDNMAVRESRP